MQILDDHRHLLAGYAQLLDLAVRDYLLVVGLDASVDEHRLSYETPLYVADDTPSRLIDALRRIRASKNGYRVSYETTVPANLKSYHLVVRTAPEADLARMYLSTNADGPLADGIVADLRWLADRHQELRASGAGKSSRKVVELQAQTVLRTLAELLRRRKWEASQSGLDVSESALPACHRLAAAATTGDAVRTGQGELDLDNSLLRHPDVTADVLRRAAEEISGQQLGEDLVLVDAVTDNQGQAYWRRSGDEGEHGELVRVRAGLVLTDAGELGPRSVMFYALAVAATAYLLGWLLVGGPWPYGARATEKLGNVGDGQSVITMLLLVPGFLYTRLAAPPRRSVAAYLRTMPRTLAQLCIVSAAGLAAAIATKSPGEIVQVFLTLAVGLPVLAAVALASQRAWHAAAPLHRVGVPRWVGGGRGRPLPANVRFDSTGRSR
ncbi:hypothetical protein [Amycolatopsis suaedae]|uniref:hypothetical protein n=1 Tax=Amycolatopsis suaedae TaxID=2510978 RepID=UPI001F0E6F78|nr:hypothetical protein [Amycolatopsis suaedae]